MGEVLKEVLPNGVTLLVKPTEGAGIVALNVFIRGGITDEDLPGVTNLTTYLLIKGSKNFSKEEISSAFEDFGGSIATSTADEYGEIEILTKVEGLEKGLTVLRDILLNPLFPEEDLEREKKNVLTAIKSKKENPFKFAYSELKKLTFEGTPYERDTLGDEESVKKITASEVKKRWNQLLKGRRFVVSLVGDLENPKETLKLLKETFGEIPEGDFKYPNYEREIKNSQLKVLEREGSQATVLCAFNAPHCKSEYYPAGKVFNAVLGDGFTSLLFRELREKRGYAYATTSFYPTKVNMPRLFAYIGTSPQKAEKALEDLLKVTQEFPFTEEDVEIAKRKIIGDWLIDHQTRLRQSWYLGWFETLGLGFEKDFKFTQLIKDVTFKEVLEIREKFIDHQHQCVLVRP
ncbi:MAG: insulinase family protein [Gammaproteobacteria bacterium]|nr:MAG: insulinase family protein [Gammaproteobacteria bacterium]RTZ69777.1 MAG: insulinase family protein [Aquificaceae bacterium]